MRAKCRPKALVAELLRSEDWKGLVGCVRLLSRLQKKITGHFCPIPLGPDISNPVFASWRDILH